MSYEEEILEFRRQKDDFFKNDPHSPLTPEQKKDFKGLKYFPPDEKYRFVVNLEENKRKPITYIVTNTGDAQEFIKFGTVRFEVDGIPCKLTVFKAPDSDYYFIPFMDLTTGEETYGSGRYVDISPTGNPGEFILDFNLAYNPYCAYNENWVCPVTPRENRLPCRIEAGEKRFK